VIFRTGRTAWGLSNAENRKKGAPVSVSFLEQCFVVSVCKIRTYVLRRLLSCVTLDGVWGASDVPT
jgi:hypothetical protein